MESLEKYFDKFRKNIIGIDKEYDTSYGKKIIFTIVKPMNSLIKMIWERDKRKHKVGLR